jgi:GDP-L-fucose synthase
MIGRHVVEKLRPHAVEVIGVSLDSAPREFSTPLLRLDLTDLRQAREAVRGADLLVHVAGIKGSIEVTKSRPATFMTPLLQMNANATAAAVLEGVQKVIFTSSIGVYPSREVLREEDFSLETPPMDTFPGWAKRIAELHLESIALEIPQFEYAVVRPGNVYGPWDNFDPKNAMVVGSLLGKARGSETTVEVWGDGSAIRDFVYAADVADLVARIAQRDHIYGVFNAGSGKRESIRDLVETCREVTGKNFVYTPERSGGFPVRVLDISRAKQELGWTPATSLKAGIRSTWNWLVNRGGADSDRLNYFSKPLSSYQG